MAKPDSRWQLLLVADDGRIVPFKRIKGIVLTLTVLLVFLGLFCAGLGWQYTAEKVRHRKTKDLLTNANRQLNHYKSEVELITAELVLAEVRMEEAGLPVTKRRHRTPKPSPLKPPALAASEDAAEQPPEAETTSEADADRESAAPRKAAKPTGADSSGAAPAEEKEKEKPAAVALGDLAIRHDTQKKVLMARFRVNNSAPGSSKVAGKCVAVLKNDRLETDSWMALPKVALVDGVPDGKDGQAFRISRFIDMELMAPVETDPSVFDTARVYVFDSSGDAIVEKDYPITLAPSVPAAEAESAKSPSGQPAENAAAAVAVADIVLTHHAGSQTLAARFRVKNAGERSSPVAGRCVVLLKNGQEDQDSWLTMPQVKLADGQPQGNRGSEFRISRFRDMEIKVQGVADPSGYKSATVYVFDTSGNVLLEETVPVTLPAPSTEAEAPKPATESQPGAAGASSGMESAARQAPIAAPSEDPSLMDEAAPGVREDSRSRF